MISPNKIVKRYNYSNTAENFSIYPLYVEKLNMKHNIRSVDLFLVINC